MECLNIVDICRACQDKTQEESQIFIFATVNLPDIYKETTSLDIHENDGLPNILCCTCYSRLLEAYNFRKMCSASVLHFQQILSMNNPEEKYILPEHPQPELMDALDIKTEPDVPCSPNSHLKDLYHPPDIDDSLNDISSMDRDDFPIEVSNEPHRVKLEPDPHDDASLFPIKLEKTHKKLEKSPELQKKKQRILPGEPTKLECGFCNSKFHRKSHLEMHIWKKHLGLKPAWCKICRKEFRTSTLLRKHLYTHEGIESKKDIDHYMCEICGIENVTADDLKSHVSTHRKENMWCCGCCSYKSVTKESLKQHVKVVHQGVKDFHCPRCERSFTAAAGLKTHMLRHELIKNHVCTVCGVRKVTATELRSHMKTHITQIKEHQCSECKKSFGTANSLKHHIMVHTGERPHGCSICSKRFITPQQLKIHMNIHTGEKISCEFCEYKTFYRLHMRRHVKVIHQGVRNYHCPQCNKSFGTAIILKNHVMTHTGEKPHACSKCEKRYFQLSTLKKHMKTHLNPKPKTKISSTTKSTPEPKTESQSVSYLFD